MYVIFITNVTGAVKKKKKTPSVCTLFYQLNNYTGCDIKLMLELVP